MFIIIHSMAYSLIVRMRSHRLDERFLQCADFQYFTDIPELIIELFCFARKQRRMR